MTMKDTKGVYFSVWAPCAMRVSVVGDFNLWDGRRHPMRKLGDSGIFELFIPGLHVGMIYKYEIKAMDGGIQLKSDPYASYCELRPDNASVIWDMESYSWNDGEWLKKGQLRILPESRFPSMRFILVHGFARKQNTTAAERP